MGMVWKVGLGGRVVWIVLFGGVVWWIGIGMVWLDWGWLFGVVCGFRWVRIGYRDMDLGGLVWYGLGLFGLDGVGGVVVGRAWNKIV